MQTFAKVKVSAVRICLSVVTLLILLTTSKAQQSHYPYDLNLSFGGGLIGNSNVNTTLQPELDLSYVPDKYGIGLSAGIMYF